MTDNSSNFVKNTQEGIERVKKGQYAYLLEVNNKKKLLVNIGSFAKIFLNFNFKQHKVNYK